ncbi:MAG: hypothetical protein OJF61_002202 [Rhodanobacteraceae bacterium]|nr:MAG: hypothetical protein OJF61_002202 [Rhodanobacteraceae bacterium]
MGIVLYPLGTCGISSWDRGSNPALPTAVRRYPCRPVDMKQDWRATFR